MQLGLRPNFVQFPLKDEVSCEKIAEEGRSFLPLSYRRYGWANHIISPLHNDSWNILKDMRIFEQLSISLEETSIDLVS